MHAGEPRILHHAFRQQRDRPLLREDLAEDRPQGELDPPLMPGAAELHRPLPLEEHLGRDARRLVGHMRDDVIPIAAAALDRVERHPHMHEPVAALHPQRLHLRERHSHSLRQVVRNPLLDPEAIAHQADQLLEREPPPAEFEPFEGVVDRRVVHLQAEHGVGRRPRPRRVSGELRIACEPQPQRGRRRRRLHPHRRGLEAESHHRRPDPFANPLRDLRELRL